VAQLLLWRAGFKHRSLHIGFVADNVTSFVSKYFVFPRRRWEDNIKMDLREVAWGGTDWINLAQDRDRWRALVNAVMNLRVP
jgi:hypothetical protein